MDKKLTLTINENLIDFAKEYSKNTHQSISNILEKHLEELRDVSLTKPLPNITSRLYGALEGQELPDKKSLRRIIHEKSIN